MNYPIYNGSTSANGDTLIPQATYQTLDTIGGLINFTVTSNETLTSVATQTASNSSRGGPYLDFYNMARNVTGLVCYPIICVFGLIGNMFILIVLSRKPMHTSTNVYLMALAISDSVRLANDFLYFVTVLLYKTKPTAGNMLYAYLYPYAHYIFNMSAVVSSWLTVSVAIERYILVCHPTRAKVMCTITRSRVISFLVCFLMVTLTFPSALRYRTITVQRPNITYLDVEVTELWRNTVFVAWYTWIQNLLRSIIPLFLLIVMNTFIINSLRKTRANKRMASRNRITVMLIIVIIFFIVCITPDAIMSSRFGYHEAKSYLVKGIREITDMLLTFNAAMNFYLYVIFNRIFRNQFSGLCCSRCRSPSDTSPVAEPSEHQYKRLTDAHPNTVSNGLTVKSASVQSVV